MSAEYALQHRKFFSRLYYKICPVIHWKVILKSLMIYMYMWVDGALGLEMKVRLHVWKKVQEKGLVLCVCVGGGVCWPRGNDKVKAALLDTLYGLIIKYLSILRYNFSQLLCYLLPTFYLPQYSLIKAFLKNICFKSITRDYGYQL